MGLLDKLRGEFIDIIEWTEPSNNDILGYRFPRYQNEIKNGAKLTVREGQAAVFVSEGQVADVYTPGMYTLETQNLPILSTIKGWKYGFNSPFKAEVYFVSTRQWTDQKWGTQNPVMLRDPEFGPVRLRAFGTYAFRVGDPATFLRQLVATDPSFETYEIANQLRNVIVSRFVDAIGTAKIPMLDLGRELREAEPGGPRADRAGNARMGSDDHAVLRREHVAAAGSGEDARQAVEHGRARQPRPVHAVSDSRSDRGRGEEPRRDRRCGAGPAQAWPSVARWRTPCVDRKRRPAAHRRCPERAPLVFVGH